LLRWINADELAGATFVFKLHDAINQENKRIVFAAAHVVAGFPFRAALARDDVAAENSFAAKFLQPSRCDCESRPLRDEPTPFLCAIVFYPIESIFNVV
jgi:hypothetical protein